VSDKYPVSIVICALNEEHRIKDAINSAKANNPFEIIVVEGGSVDNTVEVAKKYTDKVHSVDNFILGYKRAYGAEISTQKYILYLDADHILEDGALKIMINDLEKGGYVGIQATLKSVTNDTYWEEGMEYNINITDNDPSNVAVIGMPCLYKSEILKQINFDKNIGAGDDTDLCYRLAKNGYTLGISNAICFQKHRSNFKETLKKFMWYGEGDCEFGLKHRERLWSIFTHPMKNYFFKKSLISIKNGHIKYVPFFMFTGLVRHIGFYKYLLKTIMGDAKDSRTLNRNDKDY
jgi:glycosyltransferase involved in cell wall biosynthesis